MKDFRAMRIQEKGMKLIKREIPKTEYLSDDRISDLTLAALNKIPQLSYKKTATPKIIGIAVRNTVIYMELSFPHLDTGWGETIQEMRERGIL